MKYEYLYVQVGGDENKVELDKAGAEGYRVVNILQASTSRGAWLLLERVVGEEDERFEE